MKITEKVSHAIYVLILNGQMILKNAKNCAICNILNTWNVRSNSYTRVVTFIWPKAAEKCQNSNLTIWVILHECLLFGVIFWPFFSNIFQVSVLFWWSIHAKCNEESKEYFAISPAFFHQRCFCVEAPLLQVLRVFLTKHHGVFSIEAGSKWEGTEEWHSKSRIMSLRWSGNEK